MEIKIQVVGDTSIPGLRAAVDSVIQQLVPEVQSQIRRRTPIDTGNARRGWNTRNTTIENKVPYIERLEKGYSKQAPNGFVRQGINAAIENIGKSK